MATKTEDRPITAAEMAAVDFEPLCAEDLEKCKPPSNAEFDEMVHDHMPTLRIAWLTLGKTKPELVEIMRSFDDESGCNLMDDFISATAFFKQALFLLEKAEARMLCAGSVIEIEDDEKPATSATVIPWRPRPRA
ncbi:MAG: hypothetical protein ACLPSW_02505 [Roseiarcus sp.]